MNKIVELIDSIKNKALTTLNLAEYNKRIDLFNNEANTTNIRSFQDLLDFLKNNPALLANVQTVDLKSNDLSVIPQFVFSLKKLKKLDLYRNRLKSLPLAVKKLEKLEILELGENNLEFFPGVILLLPNLKELYIYCNQLRDLSPGIGKMVKLETLIAYSNKIEKIPEEIADTDSIRTFNVKDNQTIGNVPEKIYIQGINAVKSYFQSLKQGRPAYLYEAKIVIVGNGGVGKTTILKNLMDNHYGTVAHKCTHGVDVKYWYLAMDGLKGTPCVKLNIWDFGGQGKYRDIQQFFCTPNTLYLFVTAPAADKKNEEDKYIDRYWLHFISAYGRDAKSGKGNPIIYIVNKMDQATGEKEKPLNRKDLTDEFNIVDFIEISCRSGKGIRELENAIKKHLPRIDTFGQKLNRKWLNVRTKLEEMQKSTHLILNKEYENICDQYNIADEDCQRDELLKYLTVTGTILSFGHIPGAQGQVVLNPDWLMIAVYRVMDYSNDRINQDGLKSIWEEYHQWERDELIELMQMIDLCYRIEEEGESVYIVPALFPDNPPDDVAIKEAEFILKCEFEFKPFIPAGILLRLIARQNHRISRINRCWKNGVIFEDKNGSLAQLVESWKENKIVIGLKGSRCTELIAIIKDSLEYLMFKLQKMKKLKVLEMEETLSYEGKKMTINQLRQTATVDGISDVSRYQASLVHKIEHPTDKISGSKKILILATNPNASTSSRFDKEIREIKRGLDRAKRRDQFELTSILAVCYKDIRRAFLDFKPQIVHFIGYGDKEGLKVEDEAGNAASITTEAISDLFGLCSEHIETVILNACYSAPQANAIGKHIDYVIGMWDKITDDAAIEFSVGFYDALMSGESVDKAFAFGCNAIMQMYPDFPAHLIPLLKKRKGKIRIAAKTAGKNSRNKNKNE